MGQIADDFLSGQRSAAPFHHVPGVIDFVRAVDVDGELVGQHVEHANAVSAQSSRGALTARDGAFEALFHRGQRVDEAIDGRAGADADDGSGYDVGECGLTDERLELVGGEHHEPRSALDAVDHRDRVEIKPASWCTVKMVRPRIANSNEAGPAQANVVQIERVSPSH